MDNSIDAVVAELCGMLQQYNKGGIDLTAATDLGSELEIDSVEVMDLIMEIEDKYDIDIPINLVSDIERIGDLAKLVCSRMEGR